ncbi:hypothetical protein [Sphaerisporangium rhizosphaerae]|uniref:Lipoprotein n=1 Tax=Sphaerisporangium rhizosphaerae TaxID=2269375 RepID=A0ABW2P971_9ACTN
MRTQLLAGCLLPLLLVATAACTRPADGEHVASAGGSAAPTATASLSLLDQGIRWARCMREHGVPQPDPVVNHGDGIRYQGLAKDAVDGNVLEKAQQACESLRPVLPADVRQLKQGLSRVLAQCMREQGVADFPDPEPDGHFEIEPSVENDPRFPAAKETCDAREDAAAASARPSPRQSP